MSKTPRMPGDSLMSMQSPIKITPTAQAQPIYFAQHTVHLGGHLTDAAEDHALFRYATIASNIWKNHYDSDRVRELEGQAVQQINARQVFANIARWYGVTPEGMAKAWPRIDQQFFHLGWPMVPRGFGLRQGDNSDSVEIIHPTGGSTI